MHHYQFPIIRNISDVLPAIEGCDEFYVAEKDGYTVINYMMMSNHTFPPVIVDASTYDQQTGMCEVLDHLAAVRRECRGIIFDSRTGDIIRRPFHKFFNVNEREETLDKNINMSRPHVILEKLDGSMIAPFAVKTGNYVTKMDGGYYEQKVIWGTKMGATEVAKPVEEFVNNNPQYDDFAAIAIATGYTPIFEWCSRKQRIVLDYGSEDQLVLTALRDLTTGEYSDYSTLQRLGKKYDIPVVRAFDPQTDMKAFLEYVRDLEELEGFVVRFDSGHMCKLKCDWYVQIHKVKDRIVYDRNIVEIIIDENLDDLLPFLMEDERERIMQFQTDFWFAINNVNWAAKEIFDTIQDLKMDRKTFALGIATTLNPAMKALIFKHFDDSDGFTDTVIDTIRGTLSHNGRYENLRDQWFPEVRYNA